MRHFGTYPRDWVAISMRIKEKAGNRCERCHHPAEGPWKTGHLAQAMMPQYELAQTVGLGRVPCDDLCTHPKNGKQRMLTVHHLDLDKSNVEDWNLAALCQGCHLSVQGRVDMHQEYVFEHTEWMKPHVAGRDAAMAAGTWPREHSGSHVHV